MSFHCVRYIGNQIGPITKGNLSYFFFGPVRRKYKWSSLSYQVVSHYSLCQFALLSLTGNGDVQRLEPSRWLFKIVQVWQCYCCLLLCLPSQHFQLCPGDGKISLHGKSIIDILALIYLMTIHIAVDYCMACSNQY